MKQYHSIGVSLEIFLIYYEYWTNMEFLLKMFSMKQHYWKYIGFIGFTLAKYFWPVLVQH